jgi:diguanylate cyclase (GGDEF)-like protein
MVMQNQFFVIFIFMYWLCHGLAYASDNVLLLNSYHPQYRWTDEITRGVQVSLALDIKSESLHVEYMDKRRFIDDPIYSQKLIDLLQYKYKHNKPDIVITSDDAAYYFILEFGEQLFPGVPIVFCGVNVFDPQSISNRNNITGIAEGMDILGNLELITSLHPKLRKIIMIGDTTGLGLRMVNSAKLIKQDWQNKSKNPDVALDIWDSFSLEELFQKVNELPTDTAILMLAVHKDRLGKYFSFEEHLPVLSAKSKVPIYGMWGALMIGRGVVGGMMNDPYEHGFNTGKMALEILSGTPITQLQIKTSAVYKPRFDYAQLQRFGLEKSLLPKNSVIYNQPFSVYQKNKQLINTVALVFIILVLLITFLVKNISQRVNAQKELYKYNQKLDATVKKRTFELEQRNDELRIISKSMNQLAHTDSLTGLNNRRAAEKNISAYLKRYNITFKHFSLAILDIDHFKMVNDNFGHQIGDKVLEAIAETLTISIRPSDRVYRWGGEEFLVELSETPISDATNILNRLAANIRKVRVHNVGVITVSIGVSEFVKNDDFDSIVKRADDALYRAKNSGRDKLEIG